MTSEVQEAYERGYRDGMMAASALRQRPPSGKEVEWTFVSEEGGSPVSEWKNALRRSVERQSKSPQGPYLMFPR